MKRISNAARPSPSARPPPVDRVMHVPGSASRNRQARSRIASITTGSGIGGLDRSPCCGAPAFAIWQSTASLRPDRSPPVCPSHHQPPVSVRAVRRAARVINPRACSTETGFAHQIDRVGWMQPTCRMKSGMPALPPQSLGDHRCCCIGGEAPGASSVGSGVANPVFGHLGNELFLSCVFVATE